MKDSDWKLFKAIKKKALEKFCENTLAELRALIGDENIPVQERYLLNYKLVKKRDKKMASLFNEKSRSKAPLQLIAIRGEGLADEALVSRLSKAFREKTDPARSNWLGA
ncbi:MAG: hypothetical protein KDI74_07970 [Gammaproteobacteria bacterium]|nr:hypothetical protein [Gammaproteobacteria bacterium]